MVESRKTALKEVKGEGEDMFQKSRENFRSILKKLYVAAIKVKKDKNRNCAILYCDELSTIDPVVTQVEG